MKIRLFILFLFSMFLTPNHSIASVTYENLRKTTASLYEISGKIMSNSEFINSLPAKKRVFYAYAKSRVDLAVSNFEAIAVVIKVYDQSSDCKINIVETVHPYIISSKAKAEYMLRQLQPIAEDAKSLDLVDLNKNILLAINEVNEGLETLNRLTFFMDKDWPEKLGKNVGGRSTH